MAETVDFTNLNHPPTDKASARATNGPPPNRIRAIA